MSSEHASNYRRDIDGLRAIAVISVIIFHLKEHLLPGGFVGVDIFFVISGYLISNQIFVAVAANRFSILDFYRRRVKRIAPAMFVVLVVTLLISQSILRPQDAERVAESALFSLMSLANVYFWAYQDTSYFAASSSELPLLHLWSLGVEEQFYVVWPLVALMAGATMAKSRFLIGMILVAAASFIAGEYFFTWSPSFVYYMLPTRAGELLIGCILAHPGMKSHFESLNDKTNKVLSTTGLLLIIASLAVLSESEVFPGLRAIPPTLGAALIIGAGMNSTTFVTRFLSFKPMVFIGLISYSAYLWHWPLIAFMNYGYGSISVLAAIIIFVLTLFLAWLTYLFVETPMRHKSGSAYTIIFRQYVIPASVLGIVCLTCMKIDGYGFRYIFTDYKQQLAQVREATKPATKYDYVCQRDVLTVDDLSNDNCVIGKTSDDKTPVLLWGDSNAAHYLGILGKIAEQQQFAIRNLEIGACPPLLENVEPYSKLHRVKDCQLSSKASKQAFEQHATIIIGGSWTKYLEHAPTFLTDFTNMVSELVVSGKNVVILGKIPIIPSHDRYCREKALSTPFLVCKVEDVPVSKDVSFVNQYLLDYAAKTPNVWYFDVTEPLCPESTCSAYDDQGNLRYFDSGHLTLEASWKLGEHIVKADLTPKFFEQL